MEWVAISSSRGSFRPRDQTQSLASPFTTTPCRKPLIIYSKRPNALLLNLSYEFQSHSLSLLVSSTVTQWTVAYQAPLFMGFSRQENWSGLPFPSPGDLPNPGIETGSGKWPHSNQFFPIWPLISLVVCELEKLRQRCKQPPHPAPGRIQSCARNL